MGAVLARPKLQSREYYSVSGKGVEINQVNQEASTLAPWDDLKLYFDYPSGPDDAELSKKAEFSKKDDCVCASDRRSCLRCPSLNRVRK